MLYVEVKNRLIPNSNIFSSSISLLSKLLAFSIVQIAISTEANPPPGEELPINPSTLKKLSDAIN